VRNRKTFLDEKIEEHKEAVFKLSQIRDAIIAFFVMYLIAGSLLYLVILSDVLSHKASFLEKTGLFTMPGLIIIGIITLKYTNSFIRSYKTELKISEKERDAELQVQDFLKKSLTEDYHIFENVYLGHGDIDAVVVGPTGIFVVEVKSHSGTIALNSRNGISIIDGEPSRKNYRRQSIIESNLIKKYLDNQTGFKSYVLPVLVFPFADVMKDIFLEDKNDNYKVPVLSEKTLLEYIHLNKQNSLIKERVEKYSAVLEEAQKEYIELTSIN
jgi:hypothetical protein